MTKAFIMGLLVCLFVVSIPLVADPGGSAVSFVASDQFVSSSAAVVETQAISSGSFEFAPITDKSVAYAIAGGGAAVVGVILVLIMVDPFTHLRYRRRDTGANLMNRSSHDSRKRTKSPVLKMRAAS